VVEKAELHQELKSAVRELCRSFPDVYWRELDAKRGYPEEFVQALTKAGYMATLIPEEYGGAGLVLAKPQPSLKWSIIPAETPRLANAQMYIMGTLLRHGSEAQKKKYLPAIASGQLRLQAFAVTEPTTGSDTTQIKDPGCPQG